jgi:hypothetical protein
MIETNFSSVSQEAETILVLIPETASGEKMQNKLPHQQ